MPHVVRTILSTGMPASLVCGSTLGRGLCGGGFCLDRIQQRIAGILLETDRHAGAKGQCGKDEKHQKSSDAASATDFVRFQIEIRFRGVQREVFQRREIKRQVVCRPFERQGVTEADLNNLTPEILAEAPMPETISLGMRLAAAWGEPPFADEEGNPLPLPRLSSQSESVSFESLVASVSKDIRARAVLDEWLRLGVVVLDAEDRVCLKAGAFVPQRGFEEKAFYLGLNLHDHAAAIADNLEVAEGTSPWLERCVHYDAVHADDLAQLRKDAENGAMRLLRNINRKAADSEARAADIDVPRKRLTLGVYFYADEAERNEPNGKDGQ